ncbi:MAG: gliding motility-associated C-terminal domain-containing protein [Bacteroidales bacterium]|nr:gliding motility-associated C-terminal domain-containing protein [Bacteroidales bacterium]
MFRSIVLILFVVATFSKASSQVSALFDIDQTSACEMLTVNLTNRSIPSNIDSIVWDFGDGHTLTDVTVNYGETYQYTYTTPGQYTLSLTAYLGTYTAHKNVIINVYGLPNANFTSQGWGYLGVRDTFYFSKNRFLFVANYQGDTNHIWTIDGISQLVYTDSMIFNFPTAGNYTVTHIVEENGCIATTQQTIEIKAFEVKAPNIFSPNDDGINDVFYVPTDGSTKYTLTIFNRHGNRVYYREGTIVSWDGYSYWGELLNPGNYFYFLESENGESLQGVVYLNR